MKTEEKTAHPLMAGELKYLTSWKEWRKLWDETPQVEFRHSLLHFGPKIPEWDICFYLEIAHGAFDSFALGKGEEDRLYSRGHTVFGEVQSKEEIRRVLTDKAFTALCLEFFRNKADSEGDLPSWMRRIKEPGVLQKVLEFFSPNLERSSSRCGRIMNLPGLGLQDKHPYNIAYQFVLELATFCWDGFTRHSYRYWKEKEELAELFKPHRPKILEILWALDELYYLLPKDRWPNKEELNLLKELVLLAEIRDYYPHSAESRPVATVEEALLTGSQAAAVYLLLTIKSKEHARLEHEAELRREIDEAHKKLSRSSLRRDEEDDIPF